jgi:hypothetical protein
MENLWWQYNTHCLPLQPITGGNAALRRSRPVMPARDRRFALPPATDTMTLPLRCA